LRNQSRAARLKREQEPREIDALVATEGSCSFVNQKIASFRATSIDFAKK
jgi:hypothetical protein